MKKCTTLKRCQPRVRVKKTSAIDMSRCERVITRGPSSKFFSSPFIAQAKPAFHAASTERRAALLGVQLRHCVLGRARISAVLCNMERRSVLTAAYSDASSACVFCYFTTAYKCSGESGAPRFSSQSCLNDLERGGANAPTMRVCEEERERGRDWYAIAHADSSLRQMVVCDFSIQRQC